MQSIKKMGSLGKIMGMLPGMGEMKSQIDQIDDRELDRVAAIIQSMTPAERADAKILNGSRRARIAKGAGVTVTDVNGLVDRFGQAQKMMRQMGRGGGMPGMPGMPGGFPGMPGGSKKSKGKSGKQQSRKKGRSGNPAKRALQQSGSGTEVDMGSLPPDLRKMLQSGG